MRNVQMAIFSTPFAAASVLIADGEMLRAGALVGFAVGSSRPSDLVPSVASFSFVFRYADNILKAFAVGASIALNGVLSCALWDALLEPPVVGAALVAIASVGYTLAPRDGGGRTPTGSGRRGAARGVERERA